ncbi:MAG: hypothetical protein NW223_05060, partial [Hyphomicrobiaceae bacterium]|nr:hypothetical protein [Hyphomicrobiaceae bacterium]
RGALDEERAEKHEAHTKLRAELTEREARLKGQYEQLVKKMPEIIANFLGEEAIRARRERSVREAKASIERERNAQEEARAQHRAQGSNPRSAGVVA